MTEGQIIAAAWLIGGAAVAAYVLRELSIARAWLVQREDGIKNPAVRQALEFATNELARVAQTVVTGLNTSVTADLKASGRWDADVARAVKWQAISLIKAQLSDASQVVLHAAGVDLPTAISNSIEAAVGTAPNRAPTPAPASPKAHLPPATPTATS